MLCALNKLRIYDKITLSSIVIGGMAMKSNQIRNSGLLLIAAIIWGTAFSAQSAGMAFMGPFAFTAARNFIGAAVLLPFVILSKDKSESGRLLFISGIICGILLGLASCLQQYGLKFTTAGKAGFVTALYIIIIPIIGIFLKKKCSYLTWIAVFIALVGVYLLCMNESLTINRGDVFEFLCAFVFAAQILSVSAFSHRVNAYRFACIEFLTAGVFSVIMTILFGESVSVSSFQSAWLPVLFTGVMSSGVAYTLQIIGERDLNPTIAALIMSLEACVSVISGWLILGQSLTPREIIGCAVMFAAIILAQIKQPQ